jgi:hypothetical protein
VAKSGAKSKRSTPFPASVNHAARRPLAKRTPLPLNFAVPSCVAMLRGIDVSGPKIIKLERFLVSCLGRQGEYHKFAPTRPFD